MAPQQGDYRTVEPGIEEAKLNDAPPPRRPLRALPFVLLALVPFGAHFFKGALSALQLLLPLSKGEYGLLHSMFALPNATIAPVLGGLLYDAPRLRKHALTLFAAVCLLGGALCAWGLSQKPNTETLAAIYTGGGVLGLDRNRTLDADHTHLTGFLEVSYAVYSWLMPMSDAWWLRPGGGWLITDG